MVATEEKNYTKIMTGITPVIEDYLKAIYKFELSGNTVKTFDIAEHLNVKPPTVTAMFKQLAELKLITHKPYRGVELTANGRLIALEIVRHHRLIELFLVKALGYSWDEVHDEAEILEHFISEKLERRMAAYLGDPTHDPHGEPIPAFDGSLPESNDTVLTDLPIGEKARIGRVVDQAAERLIYLAKLGLKPGAKVTILEKAPFDGPLTIKVGKKEHILDHRLAQTIFIGNY